MTGFAGSLFSAFRGVLSRSFCGVPGFVGSLFSILHRVLARDFGGMSRRFRGLLRRLTSVFCALARVRRSVLRQCDRKHAE
jgi:hypothetical protein